MPIKENKLSGAGGERRYNHRLGKTPNRKGETPSAEMVPARPKKVFASDVTSEFRMLRKGAESAARRWIR
jgi:hypothetical protein